jgi:hypothetical protein
MQIDYEIPLNTQPEDVFPLFKDYLVKNKIFEVLENHDFIQFHQKLYNIVFQPHGLGIAVAVMAQVNVAGNVLLQESDLNPNFKTQLLKNIICASEFVSLGVSEKGWKGQISNICSEIKDVDGNLTLNGSKSFLTNGQHCKNFLVVAKFKEEYRVIILDRATQGLKVEPFSLPYAKEATHCSLEFLDIKISQDQVFLINYKDLGDMIRKSELLSLSVIGIAYLNKILSDDSQIFKDKSLRIEILELKKKLDWFYSYVFYISDLKSKNLPWKHLAPYGFSILIQDFKRLIQNSNPDFDFLSVYPDLDLFNLIGDEFQLVRTLGRIH